MSYRGLGFTRTAAIYASAIASMLAGAQVAHLLLQPDLTIPDAAQSPPAAPPTSGDDGDSSAPVLAPAVDSDSAGRPFTDRQQQQLQEQQQQAS